MKIADLLDRLEVLEHRVAVMEHLRAPLPNSDAPAQLVRALQQRVAHAYGMTVEELLGDKRDAHFVWTRHLCIWLARRMTGARSQLLGDLFCRDHSLVIHALHKVSDAIDTDPNRRKEVQAWLTNLDLKDAECSLSAPAATNKPQPTTP